MQPRFVLSLLLPLLTLFGMASDHFTRQAYPTVTITAPTVVYSPSANITVEWCSTTGELDTESRQIWLSNGDSTSKFDFQEGIKSGCAHYATSQATLTLTAGVYTITALIEDLGGSQGMDYHAQLVYAVPPVITLVTPAVNAADGRAIVRSRFPLILATYDASHPIDTSSLVVTVGGDTVTALVRRQTTLMEWEVDSLRQFVPGDSNDISVRLCDIYAACATVTRRAVLDSSGAPVIQFTGMPLEANGRVSSVPVGPGLAVTAADVETGTGVPGYISMGEGRSVGLLYSQRTSHPRALVNVDIELTWPSGTPSQIKAVLYDGAVKMDSLVETNTNCTADAGRLCRIALQADFAGTSFTRAARKWLTVAVSVTSGGVTKTSTDSVEVVLVDHRRSRYGSGWAVAGLSRLDSAGSDMILVGANGLTTIFRGSGGRYLSPPGDVSTLRWNVNQWELTTRGVPNAKIVFDAAGRMTSMVDRNNNTTRVRYLTGTTRADSLRVDSVVDPTGRFFVFAYTDTTRVVIADFTGRQSVMRINTSRQLVVDTVASPSSRRNIHSYTYTSTGSNAAIALRTRTDAVGTTGIAYSSRNRFVRDTLPPVLPETGSTTVKPLVTYTALEIRALGNLISADGLYSSLREPRGNLIRNYLNRWGGSTRLRDSVGTISRASFAADGRVMWSQAVHDSTRVHYRYDAMSRLVRTFRRRTSTDSVRIDSLVYDTLHRVVRRIGPLGAVTYYTYDTRNNVTSVTDPRGFASNTWYRTNGLVDSARGPEDTASTRWTYDGSSLNISGVVDAAGNQVAEYYQDSVGRDVAVVRWLPGRESGDTLFYQWSRTLTYYAGDNLVDSSRAERTRDYDCPDLVCSFGEWAAATWPSGLADSLYYSLAVIHRDGLGRDTLVTDKFGRGVRRVYGSDGRLRAVYPFRDSTGIADSMRYDIAGNVRFRWTRRGHMIEHRYDIRGRDTLTLVPGVGNYRRLYGEASISYNEELTRVIIDGYVDSIGGVNPNMAWVYNRSGQLRRDTAQGLATVYTRDRYGRDSLIANVIGTTALRYHATMGHLDEVISPFADTISNDVVSSAKMRYGPATGTASGTLRRRLVVSGTDKPTSLRYEFSPNNAGYRPSQQEWGYLDAGSLGYRWEEQRGEDTLVFVARDSLDLDGWNRLTRARYFDGVTGTTVIATDSFRFDGRGNILSGATSRTYDPVTSRLRYFGNDTLHYDRAGNLDTVRTGGHVWAYTYDALNRMTAVRYDGTLIARYGYDVLGRRIARRVYAAGPNSATTEYVRLRYQGAQVVAEADSAGNLKRGYMWGWEVDDLVAIHQYTDSSHVLVVQDLLHSTRGLVDKATGTWLASWRFRVYGQPLDSAGSTSVLVRWRWAGQVYDPETGFYHMRARYYDPRTQLFTQDDPSKPYGDYGYANGNPTDGRDPSGLEKDNDRFHSIPPRMEQFMQWMGCWSLSCSGGGGLGGLFDIDQNGRDDEVDNLYKDLLVAYDEYVRKALEQKQANDGIGTPMERWQYDLAIEKIVSGPTSSFDARRAIVMPLILSGRILMATAMLPKTYGLGDRMPGRWFGADHYNVVILHTSAFGSRHLENLGHILVHEGLHAASWPFITQLFSPVGRSAAHCLLYGLTNQMTNTNLHCVPN